MTAQDITFTKDQFHSLLKLVNIGNWTVNGYREEPITEYDDLEVYLCAQAKRFGLEELVVESEDTFTPSAELEGDIEIQAIIEEFEVEAFSSRLIETVAYGMATEKHGEEALEAMDPEELFKVVSEFEDQVAATFAEDGVDASTLEELASAK